MPVFRRGILVAIPSFKQAIMDDVAAREVPVYFELEDEIIAAPTKVWKWRIYCAWLCLIVRIHCMAS